MLGTPAAQTHMHERAHFRIAPVRTANDLKATVELFRAYASSLDVDLSYQNFEADDPPPLKWSGLMYGS